MSERSVFDEDVDDAGSTTQHTSSMMVSGQEDDGSILSIDELQNHGIGAADIQKLRSAGICTIKGVNMTSKRSLLKVKGLSEAKVDKIKESAARIQDAGFISALEYSLKRAVVFKLSTGCEELDKLLGGGVQSMSITEVFGEFRTGKTQLALTLCVTCQIPDASGQTGKAAFIDTEGTFRPERLKEIATRFGLDPDETLDNVIFARAFNTEHQMDLITLIAAKFSEHPGEFRILVIDSIISLFRTDYSGRGELGERQQRLNQMLAKLIRVAEEYNIAVFITNQMMADPGATMTFVADPKKPVGGHVLAHASTTRVSLRKGRNENRIAKIYDAPDLPEAEATYSIGPGGIDNATA